MAYDILLRRPIRRSYARKPTVQIKSTESLVLTEPEKAMLARIALCRAQAQAGDKGAQKTWKKTVKQIVATRRKAARGDVQAQRQIAVLVQSGMFPSKKKLAPKGAPGALKPLVAGSFEGSNEEFKKRWNALAVIYRKAKTDPKSREAGTIRALVDVAKRQGPQSQAYQDVENLKRIMYHTNEGKGPWSGIID
jgi:hypothetical protein